MPQTRLHVTPALQAHLDLPKLFLALHRDLVALAGAGLADCKSLVFTANATFIADGTPVQEMAHLEIGLLSGRAPDILRAVGERALALLEAAVPSDFMGAQVSVRLVEMDRATYFKTSVA